MGPVHPSVQNPGKNTEYNADIAKKRKGRDIVTEKKKCSSVSVVSIQLLPHPQGFNSVGFWLSCG